MLTIFLILIIFIGAQFVGIGLISEYICWIYTDVRVRPRYFVQKVVSDLWTYTSQEGE